MNSKPTWPPLDGNYLVGDPQAPVAVCTLTDDGLPERLASLPGVAIAGTLATANLGIERVVSNVIANPAIARLLVCGKDSAIFGPGQSLLAMVSDGVDADRRIRGATGFDPVLRNLTTDQVEAFRDGVDVIDQIGEDDVDVIREHVARLASAPVLRTRTAVPLADARTEEFVELAAGGRRRQGIDYDPAGYLVITLDEPAGQIVVRHYRTDNTPAHLIRSRNGEAVLLALLRNDLVTQLDHAGYLGAELAKAEAAMRLGLRYVQDRPLRLPSRDEEATTAGTRRSSRAPARERSDDARRTAPAAAMPPVGPTQPHTDVATTVPGQSIQIAIEVLGRPEPGLVDAVVADPTPSDPYTRYMRTSQAVRVRYDDRTRIVMGGSQDIDADALLRVRGTMQADGHIDADAIAILTHVATVTAEAAGTTA